MFIIKNQSAQMQPSDNGCVPMSFLPMCRHTYANEVVIN